MGFERTAVALLPAVKRLGVDYDKTLTLGRQNLLVDDARLRAGFAEAGMPLTQDQANEIIARGAGYSEPLLQHLGAQRVDSIDASDFERCTIVHDLNHPLPHHLRQMASVVIDGGTLEHVFNYPTALRNALQAVRVHGHFIAVTPTNGFLGHGFYQFSPELFYRTLSLAQGFRVVCMLVKPLHWRSRWYRVPDPAIVGGRVVWGGSWPTLLYVVAQRITADEVLTNPVMQSDYETAWKGEGLTRQRSCVPLSWQIRNQMPLAAKEIRDSVRWWRDSRSSLDAVDLRNLERSS